MPPNSPAEALTPMCLYLGTEPVGRLTQDTGPQMEPLTLSPTSLNRDLISVSTLPEMGSQTQAGRNPAGRLPNGPSNARRTDPECPTASFSLGVTPGCRSPPPGKVSHFTRLRGGSLSECCPIPIDFAQMEEKYLQISSRTFTTQQQRHNPIVK